MADGKQHWGAPLADTLRLQGVDGNLYGGSAQGGLIALG